MQRLTPEMRAELKNWRRSHRWHPHQLRHNAATRLRHEFGIDIAQTILGHRLGSAVTEIYAAANVKRAREAIRETG
jgi:integrase